MPNCRPNYLLLSAAVNKVTGCQLLGTLGSLIFQILPSHFQILPNSHPTRHLLQYENFRPIISLCVQLLLTQILFPFFAQPLIPVHWLLLAVPHMGSLAFTAQFAGLFLDLLYMEFTRRCKLPLPVPARLHGKVKIIVSLPAVNIVIPTSNNLLGSLTFKTLGPHTLGLLGSQEVHQQIVVKL